MNENASHSILLGNSQSCCFTWCHPQTKSKWIAVAFLVGTVVVFGSVTAFGGVGIFASQSALPIWLAHAVGTVGFKGCLAMFVSGVVFNGIGGISCIVLLVKSSLNKHVISTDENHLEVSEGETEEIVMEQYESDHHEDEGEAIRTETNETEQSSETVEESIEEELEEDEDLRAFFEAARTGSKKDIERMLGKGIDINSQNDQEQTALHLAVSAENIEVIQDLLDRRINVNLQDAGKSTALHNACFSDEPIEMISLLINAGVDVNLQDIKGRTALHIVACFDYEDLIQPFLDGGIDLKLKNKEGNTAFHRAVKFGKLRFVRKYLELRPGDINMLTIKQTSALILAVIHGKERIVTELLNKGIDVNLKNSKGNTALHAAAYNGDQDLKTMRTLLGIEGINLHVQNCDGDTALHLAARHGEKEIVALLLAQDGIDTTLKNLREQTAQETINYLAVGPELFKATNKIFEDHKSS